MTTSSRESAESDLAYQAAILQRVSRTFALTIPQLPDGLREVVSNAYLLCRIADTVEDEPALSLAEKQVFLERFVEVVAGRDEAAAFARDLGERLSSETTEPEQDLIANTPRVIRITLGCRAPQRRAMERCIRIMSHGMVEFQRQGSAAGLKDVPQLERYCYYVAGVVGEMLAELFCDYSPEIEQRHEEVFSRSVSLGLGLQMTNILKDIWDDRRRGACWLPQDVFDPSGFELRHLSEGRTDPGFVDGFLTLEAITRRHLTEGLRFILLIPSRETGIRRHLLWTLGLAVLTLRRLHATPAFRSGQNVRLSRLSVRALILLTSGLAWSDGAIKLLFRAATRRLPVAAPPQS